VWAILGAGGTLGLVSLGGILLGPVLVVGALLRTKRTARRSTAGVLAGAGLVFLFVAYQQRKGPGVTCWRTGAAGGCDQYLNPIAWLAIGLLLVIGSVLLHKRRAA
jgi:hypothetical protein